MRISDWSSDVCSSDLHRRNALAAPEFQPHRIEMPEKRADRGQRGGTFKEMTRKQHHDRALAHVEQQCRRRQSLAPGAQDIGGADIARSDLAISAPPMSRSEEHTSELQSLMRISYAVFCLKQTNHNQTNSTLTNTN